MLLPEDYENACTTSLFDTSTDAKDRICPRRPEVRRTVSVGIPTSVELQTAQARPNMSSGLIRISRRDMRLQEDVDWLPILAEKFRRLAALGGANAAEIKLQLGDLSAKSATRVQIFI